jgi:hypothetical protein
MEKKINNFKQFLEKYYSDTFTDPTGKEGKNSIFKVNNCIKNNLPLQQNQIITLPSGCYSKMLTSDSFEDYNTCLQQFLPNEEQILNIQKCVKEKPSVNCYNGVILEISKEGDIEYVDCCGTEVVTDLGNGQQTINDCIQGETIKPYLKNEKPATIDSIDYSKEKCDCQEKQ